MGASLCRASCQTLALQPLLCVCEIEQSGLFGRAEWAHRGRCVVVPQNLLCLFNSQLTMWFQCLSCIVMSLIPALARSEMSAMGAM